MINLTKNFAFTLAEVLITLGIIGIVSAMTIPNLITTHQKKVTVTKLKKAISSLNNIYRYSNYDNEGFTSSEDKMSLSAEEYTQKYWAKYITIYKLCTTFEQCGYKERYPWLQANGHNATWTSINDTFRIGIVDSSGIVYIISNSDPGFGTETIILDLNGSQKPNQAGKDVFWLVRNEENVVPFGYELNNNQINSSCNKTGNGMYCAEKLKREGWTINSDYPW